MEKKERTGTKKSLKKSNGKEFSNINRKNIKNLVKKKSVTDTTMQI